jgi:hypothetical protein
MTYVEKVSSHKLFDDHVLHRFYLERIPTSNSVYTAHPCRGKIKQDFTKDAHRRSF